MIRINNIRSFVIGAIIVDYKFKVVESLGKNEDIALAIYLLPLNVGMQIEKKGTFLSYVNLILTLR